MLTAQFWRRGGVAVIELPVVIAWCLEGQRIDLKRPAPPRATDIFGRPVDGGTLGEEPVLFHNEAESTGETLLDRNAASMP